MLGLIDVLLAPAGTQRTCAMVTEWLGVWRTVQAEFAEYPPFIASVAAARRSDRLSWAFFSGYQGAIQTGFPDFVNAGRVGALCVHEAGRKITEVTTTVEIDKQVLHLHGHKSWAISGADNVELLVLAKRGDGPPKGPGSLVIVHVPAGVSGVRWGATRPQTVVPELTHSAITFDAVRVMPAQLVPGDGYADHAKPFRALEDIFVTGCTLAYLLSEAELGAWPTTWRQRCVAAIAMLDSCAGQDARDARIHILIAGVLSFAGDVIKESENLWQASQKEAHARWRRDQQILNLGKDARRQRATGSWERVMQEARGSTVHEH